MRTFLTKYKLSNLHVTKSLFLLILPIFAFSGLYFHFKLEVYSHTLLVGLLVMYILSIFTISAGYHRLFAHRTFKTGKVIKSILLFLGASTIENSALSWSSDHRMHHKHEDTDKDPYNINEGFFYAHIGWIMLKSSKAAPLAKDLANDPLVAFQHKYYYPIVLISNFIPFAILFALTGAWIGSLTFGVTLRLLIIHHVTYCINSYCHTIGSQPYTDKNTAKDSAIAGLFTFGESYHNFHHTFQLDYRNGYRWYNIDMTKWILFVWEKIGLVTNMKRTPDAQVLAATMVMKAHTKASRYNEMSEEFMVRLEVLKNRAIEHKKYLVSLKKEYKAIAKNRLDDATYLKLEALRKEIKQMKNNSRYSYYEWKNYLRYSPNFA